jgi:hypothetical protein
LSSHRLPNTVCLFLALGLALACVVLSGCVERRMMIRSNPPGAMAYIDDRPIGMTPCATDFTYYGSREVRLVKDGCETHTEKVPVSPPWYEIPPLDFFSENLVPGKLIDHHTYDFQLKPQALVPTEQTMERAEGLRRQTHATTGTQPTLLTPPAPPPIVSPTVPGTAVPIPTDPGAVPPPTFPGAAAPSQAPPPDGWQPRVGP